MPDSKSNLRSSVQSSMSAAEEPATLSAASATPPAEHNLLEQLIRAISEQNALSRQETIELLKELRSQTRPSNPNPPLLSHLNPLGERDNPKPALRCPMWFGPYELEHDDLHRDEVELLNTLLPGDYVVTKSDGTRHRFQVTPKYDATGENLLSLHLMFPAADEEQRQNWPPLTHMVSEVIQQQAAREARRSRILTGATPN